MAGLFGALAGVAAAGTAASFLGRLFWAFEAASAFRVQYFAILTVGAVGYAVFRKRAAAAALGGLALANLALAAPLYLGRPAAPAPGTRTYRAILANVLTANRRFDRVAGLVRDLEPDIVVLEEVNERWLRELSGLRADYPHGRAVPRTDNFGIALWSRIPLDGAAVLSWSEVEVPSIAARLSLGGRPVTAIATHPLPPRRADYFAWRNQQLEALGQYVSSQPGEVLVLGDLNMSSWSPYFGDLVRTTGLSDTRRGFGVLASWPSDVPFLRIPIDHALVSKGIRVVDRRLGPDVGSDHFPVILDFALEPGGRAR